MARQGTFHISFFATYVSYMGHNCTHTKPEAIWFIQAIRSVQQDLSKLCKKVSPLRFIFLSDWHSGELRRIHGPAERGAIGQHPLCELHQAGQGVKLAISFYSIFITILLFIIITFFAALHRQQHHWHMRPLRLWGTTGGKISDQLSWYFCPFSHIGTDLTLFNPIQFWPPFLPFLPWHVLPNLAI